MPIKDVNGGTAFVITRYNGENAGFSFAGLVNNEVNTTGTIYVKANGQLWYKNAITGHTTQLSSE